MTLGPAFLVCLTVPFDSPVLCSGKHSARFVFGQVTASWTVGELHLSAEGIGVDRTALYGV